MSQNMRATGASSPRHGHDLERVRVGDREHVGLLDPAVALDRRPVEGHALLERGLELGRGDREALEWPSTSVNQRRTKRTPRSSTVRST